MSSRKNLPKQKAVLHGIFYKTEQIKDKYYYHFLLPDIYHSTNTSHTSDTLKNFNSKVNDFFEKRIDESILFTDSSTVKINNPIYRDKDYKDFNCTTHFKCKTSDSINLTVGMEYIINCELYTYNFVDPETNLNVIGWTIKLISQRILKY